MLRTLPPGYEIPHADGTISVVQSDGTVRFKHLIIFEFYIGRKLRHDERIRFKDKNPRNLSRSNMYLRGQRFGKLERVPQPIAYTDGPILRGKKF